MTPFLLTLNFKTPISAGSLPSLDAVLAAEIAKEQGDHAIERLPLKQTDGVWHGSALFIDGPSIERSFTKTKMMPREWQDVPEGVIGSRRQPEVFRKPTGAYGGLLNRYEMEAVSVGVYLGIGDIDAVEAIVRDVPALGARRGDGFGLIESYAFDELAAGELWGLTDAGGNPARPVPMETWDRLGDQVQRPEAITVCRWRPFYWSSRNEPAMCAIPVSVELAEISLEPDVAATGDADEPD